MNTKLSYSTLSPAAQESLRQGFKSFNKSMLLLWQLGLGKFVNIWPEWGGQIMVLIHTGRKSGLRRQTPVNYAVVGGDLYCTAGFGHISDWYRNIQANPNVEVWLPDGWWAGVTEEVTAPELRLPLLRQVLIGSGFAARVAGLNPHTMSDEALDAETGDYRVIKIKRTAAKTGPGGPGELAWLWPAATLGLFLLFIFFKSRR